MTKQITPVFSLCIVQDRKITLQSINVMSLLADVAVEGCRVREISTGNVGCYFWLLSNETEPVLTRVCQHLQPFQRVHQSHPEISSHLISSHLSLSLEGRWDTTDDFATCFLHFSLFSTALWDLANSKLVHSLMLSSHLFHCLPCLLPPFTVSC